IQNAGGAELWHGSIRQLLLGIDRGPGAQQRQARQHPASRRAAAGQPATGRDGGDASAGRLAAARLVGPATAADPRRDAQAAEAALSEAVGGLSQKNRAAFGHLLSTRPSADADAQTGALDAAAGRGGDAAGGADHAFGGPGTVLADGHP